MTVQRPTKPRICSALSRETLLQRYAPWLISRCGRSHWMHGRRSRSRWLFSTSASRRYANWHGTAARIASGRFSSVLVGDWYPGGDARNRHWEPEIIWPSRRLPQLRRWRFQQRHWENFGMSACKPWQLSSAGAHRSTARLSTSKRVAQAKKTALCQHHRAQNAIVRVRRSKGSCKRASRA